jgi:hypothetical protein
MAIYSVRDLGRCEILVMSAVLAGSGVVSFHPNLPPRKPRCSARRPKYSDPFIRSQSCLKPPI